jgi:hypothetical protein
MVRFGPSDRQSPAAIPRPHGSDCYPRPQTDAAVSEIVRSFARSAATVIAFPPTDVANPHWGEGETLERHVP